MNKHNIRLIWDNYIAFHARYSTDSSTSSGSSAISTVYSLHEITTTGTGDAITLGYGEHGMILRVVYVAETAGSDTAILTPTTLAGGTTITFNNLGDACSLVYATTGGWYVAGISGAVLA